jgi:hypothetical protein
MNSIITNQMAQLLLNQHPALNLLQIDSKQPLTTKRREDGEYEKSGLLWSAAIGADSWHFGSELRKFALVV